MSYGQNFSSLQVDNSLRLGPLTNADPVSLGVPTNNQAWLPTQFAYTVPKETSKRTSRRSRSIQKWTKHWGHGQPCPSEGSCAFMASDGCFYNLMTSPGVLFGSWAPSVSFWRAATLRPCWKLYWPGSKAALCRRGILDSPLWEVQPCISQEQIAAIKFQWGLLLSFLPPCAQKCAEGG